MSSDGRFIRVKCPFCDFMCTPGPLGMHIKCKHPNEWLTWNQHIKICRTCDREFTARGAYCSRVCWYQWKRERITDPKHRAHLDVDRAVYEGTVVFTQDQQVFGC